MNATISPDQIQELLQPQASPCLSVYLPTHRRHPENQQDPIRYKNLVKQLEASLLANHPDADADALLAPFIALGANPDFWNHTWDGLAVLGSAGSFRTIKLQRPVPELATAATTFHLKPLLRIQQSADRYHILALNRREVRLYEGNRDHLDEVALAPGVPASITEALGDEHSEPHQTVASYGGTAQGSNMRHGHGSKADDADIDEQRFFRAVDRAVLEHHSRPTGIPLILAALTQYHTPFREVSHNPFLFEKGIEADPGALTAASLCERAWKVIEPEFRARLRRHAETYGAAHARALGSDDYEYVAEAAAHSRVETLLIEADRLIPGPDGDDVLDDLAELVLHRGGQVVVVPAADMPTTTGLAATFRF
jgi:hypothetical protein